MHTIPRSSPQIAELLERKPSGVVLAGARPEQAIPDLRCILGDQTPVLVDPAAYTSERANPDNPFALQSDEFSFVTLADYLDHQMELGVSAAITPTRYIAPGDRHTLDSVAAATTAISAEAIIALPLDAGWLSRQNIDDVIYVLSEIPQVKAIILGGQFNPPERVPDGVRAVRRLAELPETMLLRTDMAAFDFLSRGGLAASIGSSSSLRHTIPPGTLPLTANRRDRSPSVLIEDLVAYTRGSTLAERFGSIAPPRCACQVCRGEPITNWVRRGRGRAARAHNVSVWTREWLPNLIDQPHLATRRRYWQALCRHGIEGHARYNEAIRDPNEPFSPPPPLLIWAGEEPLRAPATAP